MPYSRAISDPPDGVSVLKYYADSYDHVFFALNPFFKVPGYSPGTAAYGPVHVEFGPDFDLVERLRTGDLPERPNQAPVDFEDLIKASGKPVAWESVRREIGSPNFQDFALAVWLTTVNGNRGKIEPAIAKSLQNYLQEKDLYRPGEDFLPAIQEPDVGRFLDALGIEEVECHDEFRDKRATIPVAAFKAGKKSVSVGTSGVHAVSAKGLLITWPHDLVYSLVCMRDDILQRVDPQDYFEGVWAGSEAWDTFLVSGNYFSKFQKS